MKNFLRKILIKIQGTERYNLLRIQKKKPKYITRKLTGRWCATFDHNLEESQIIDSK